MKKLLSVCALLLAVIMTVTGCAVKPAKYGTTVAATYGDETIYMDEAMFWLRLLQWENEASYAYLYYYYYGVTEMWKMDSGRRTQTLGQTLKEDVMARIRQAIMLNEKAAEYGVSLTAEDKEKSAKVIEHLHEDYADELFHLMGDPTDARMAEIIDRFSLASKVHDAMKKGYTNFTVTDEECESFTIQYFAVFNTADDKKEEGKLYNEELAKAILADIQAGHTMDAVEANYTGQATFSNTTYVRAEENTSVLYTEGVKLKKGESTMALSGTTWYVIYCQEELDEEATETKRTSLADSKQETYFKETILTALEANAKSFSVKKPYNDIEITNVYVAKPTTAAASEAESSTPAAADK